MNPVHAQHAHSKPWQVALLLLVMVVIVFAEWRYTQHRTGRKRRK